MAETTEERRKRIIAERQARVEERRKQTGVVPVKKVVTPEERRRIILRQRLQTKYYEITQNAKNWVSKFFYKQYWKDLWLEIQWNAQELNKNLEYIGGEMAKTPKNIARWWEVVKLFTRGFIVKQVGCPVCDDLNYNTKLNSKELFHYHQTLLNEEWLSKELLERKDVESWVAAKKIINKAKFDVTDRQKSLYDLLVAVHKERELRRMKELDMRHDTTGEPVVTDAIMKEAEHGVESNLNEWYGFFKGFKRV